MEQDPIPIITEKKCPNPKCDNYDLVFESIMTVGDVSSIDVLKSDEKYTIYRCDKCGARYKIRED